jgi:WD40 repeat protein
VTFERVHDSEMVSISVDPSGRYLQSEDARDFVLWSIAEARKLAQKSLSGPVVRWGAVVDSTSRRLVFVIRDGEEIRVEMLGFDGEYRGLGTLPFTTRRDDDGRFSTIAVLEPASGKRLYVLRDHAVYVFEVGDTTLGPPKRLDHIEATVVNEGITVDPRERFIAARHQDGSIRIWDLGGETSPKVIPEPPGVVSVRLTRDGSLLEAVSREDDENYVLSIWSIAHNEVRFLRKIDIGPSGVGGFAVSPTAMHVARSGPDRAVRLWSLRDPADAAPLSLYRGEVGIQWGPAFHPTALLMATADTSGLSLWNIAQPHATVFRTHDSAVWSVLFDPSGRWLASSDRVLGTVELWPLGGNVPAPGREIAELGSVVRGMAVTPDGARLLLGGNGPGVMVEINDGEVTDLPGFSPMAGVAFNADGTIAAGMGGEAQPGPNGALCVWRVGKWENRVILQPEPFLTFVNPHILRNGRVLCAGKSGLWLCDPTTASCELVFEGIVGQFAVTEDERRIVLVDMTEWSFGADGQAVVLDLESGAASRLDNHGDLVWSVAIDPSGTMVVTGGKDGAVRAGPISGGQPHLLLGHRGRVWSLAIDPLGRWIASGSEDTTVRLWPMPDLSEPPLHTLPREELVAKLKTLTNLRVVRDPDSATGWKLTHDPFPGWETVPTW